MMELGVRVHLLEMEAEKLTSLRLRGLTPGVMPRIVHNHMLGSNTVSFPMKILLWNCRGASNNRNLVEIIYMHNPAAFVLMETRTFF